MALSQDAVKRLMVGLASADAGNEVASAINRGLAALIVATSVSQTVDFAALQVGDKVVVVPAAAGNCHFVTVATAGNLGEAAVIGSLYVVLRSPAASALVF